MRDCVGRNRGDKHHRDSAEYAAHREGKRGFQKDGRLVRAQILRRFDITLVYARNGGVQGKYHKRQIVVHHTEKHRAHTQFDVKRNEDSLRRERTDKEVYAHRNDVQKHEYASAGHLREEVGDGIAYNEAQHRRYHAHEQRIAKHHEARFRRKEYLEVFKSQIAVAVEKRVYEDKHERRHHK